MAELSVTPVILLRLTSQEFCLISKGLNALTTRDGEPMPIAQKLRDDLTRSRAKQSIDMAIPAERVLAKLPPVGHDYGITEEEAILRAIFAD